MVVGYYAGDVPGSKRPRGHVYATMGKAAAIRHAADMQRRAGGQAANAIYKAFTCERAPRIFDLTV
jgi:hypothetical protein